MTFDLNEKVMRSIAPNAQGLCDFTVKLAELLGSKTFLILPHGHNIRGYFHVNSTAMEGRYDYNGEYEKRFGEYGKYMPMIQIGTIYVDDDVTPEKMVEKVKKLVDDAYPNLIKNTLTEVRSDQDW
jgi:hypothetical protein